MKVVFNNFTENFNIWDVKISKIIFNKLEAEFQKHSDQIPTRSIVIHMVTSHILIKLSCGWKCSQSKTRLSLNGSISFMI